MVVVSAESLPSAFVWCFGFLGKFLGGEWVHFLRQMRECKWGWELINHSNKTPFRPQKVVDVDVAVTKWNIALVNEWISVSGFHLPASTEGEAAYQSCSAYWWTDYVSCQTLAVSLFQLAKLSTCPLKQTRETADHAEISWFCSTQRLIIQK